MPERTALRAIFAGMAFLTGLRAVETWGMPSTAADWTWFYRIGLPISAVTFAYGAWRGRLMGNSVLFVPLSVVSLVRLADFFQDWYLTPTGIEPIDLSTRFGPGAFGWGMLALMALGWHTLERLLSARWAPPDSGRLCLAAPDCPSRVDVERSNHRYSHPA